MATMQQHETSARPRAPYTRVTPRLEKTIMGRLARLPFSSHPALKVDLRQEAYSNYTFGARSGPTVEFDGLCHELAHAAQFDPQEFDVRCTSAGTFHLPLHGEMEDGGDYAGPQTAQCTLRECEVFAIQYHLLECTGRKLQFERYAKEVVKLCSWLPDWWMLGGREGRPTEIPAQLRRFVDAWTADRAIERVTRWLDRTQARLALQT
jgi:hypothetical protein